MIEMERNFQEKFKELVSILNENPKLGNYLCLCMAIAMILNLTLIQ